MARAVGLARRGEPWTARDHHAEEEALGRRPDGRDSAALKRSALFASDGGRLVVDGRQPPPEPSHVDVISATIPPEALAARFQTRPFERMRRCAAFCRISRDRSLPSRSSLG